ncbi:MAG: hypothetical protein ACPG7F_15715 [Aggregatilineales bacterium]
MIIELKAHIGKDGEIVLQTPTNLPPGDVDLVITYLTAAEIADEAEWDKQFAETPAHVFDKLIEEGLADYHAGETDIFDPNIEDD